MKYVVKKKFPTKKTAGPDCFTDRWFPVTHYSNLLKAPPQNWMKHSPTSLHEASITDENLRRASKKENYRAASLMNVCGEIQT